MSISSSLAACLPGRARAGARAFGCVLATMLALCTTVPSQAQAIREPAPAGGWAGQNGGTTGGAAAAPAQVFRVRSATGLRAALSEAPGQPRIVIVQGRIDMAAPDNGGAFADSRDQARRGLVRLPSDTSLLGEGADAGLVNASVRIERVRNVIVRNLHIVNPCDVAPTWDPNDGARGDWNAEFDGIALRGASNVWIDHVHLTDVPMTDDLLPIENGRKRQCHDGALDITEASDFVTVSNSVIEMHTKTTLVGHSDGATADAGRLRVTFVGNLWRHSVDRAPRVRYGYVHVYNNYYEGDRRHRAYPHRVSIAVAHASQVLSEANVFEVVGARRCADVARGVDNTPVPGRFLDRGSRLNGDALDDCQQAPDADWRLPYTYTLLPAAEVKAAVLREAGVGRIRLE